MDKDKTYNSREIASWFVPEEELNATFEDAKALFSTGLTEQLEQITYKWLFKEFEVLFGRRSSVPCVLYGPPGTGKSYLAEAVAHRLVKKGGFSCMRVSAAQYLTPYKGETEKIIGAIFKAAAEHAPCVLILEDFELLCKNRDLSPLPDGGRTVAFLSSFSEARYCDPPIQIICTTNYPGAVDPVFLYKSQLVYVPYPDLACRTNYFKKNLSVVPLEDGLSFEDMASKTDNYSFRDMNWVINCVIQCLVDQAIQENSVFKDGALDRKATDQAAASAIEEGRVVLTRALFDEAISKAPLSDKTTILAELEKFQKSIL